MRPDIDITIETPAKEKKKVGAEKRATGRR